MPNCDLETASSFNDCFAATEAAFKEFLTVAIATQKKLQDYQASVMVEEFQGMTNEELMLEYSTHLAEEVFELKREYGSRKRWKSDPLPADTDNATDEMADIFVVAIITAMYGQFNPEKMADGYAYKLRRTLQGVRTEQRKRIAAGKLPINTPSPE